MFQKCTVGTCVKGVALENKILRFKVSSAIVISYSRRDSPVECCALRLSYRRDSVPSGICGS